jgi:hypothetical protein
MRRLLLRLKGEYMNEDGSAVDYLEFVQSSSYQEFLQQANLLRSANIDAMAESERKAFFLNVYNCLTIHGLAEDKLRSGFPGALFNRLTFYASMSYNIGGYTYSLNDMEHGILRGNRLSPTPLTRLTFRDASDPRKKYVIPCDPRIHFALNCGARSCPAIRSYSGDQAALDQELDSACQNFISNNVFVDEATQRITLSMLFKWYDKDFGASEREVLQWIASKASDSSLRESLLRVMSKPHNIIYAAYDWSLNKK